MRTQFPFVAPFAPIGDPKTGSHASPPDAEGLQVSVVVPVKNEQDNIAPLVAEICTALRGNRRFEIIYVDDGSTDATPANLAATRETTPELRILQHASSCGQSAAIRTGVLAARAPVVATLDGDGQNNPIDMPALLDIMLAANASPRLGLVAGQRAKRQDSLVKKLTSRIGNGIRSTMLGDGTRDTGCGLKAFRRDAFLLLPYFDHLHRFLPALMKREGFEVELVDVSHRPRGTGRSKYGTLDRAWAGLQDLLGVMWLIKRRRSTSAVREL